MLERFIASVPITVLVACGSPAQSANDGRDANTLEPACDASFTVSAMPATTTPVLFVANAKAGVTYAWSFGGGMPASAASLQANVTFDAGNHDVSLTVSGASCSTTTTTKQLAIACPSGSQTFDFTGGEQDFEVPACVSAVTIDAYGAQGGEAYATLLGGKGGRATGTLAVTPGAKLAVFVGGAGITAPTVGSAAGFAGGWNGGGSVHEQLNWVSQVEGLSGTGGGASDVRVGGIALANRVIVAGGGGGSAFGSFVCGKGAGGDAGGLAGLAAANSGSSCVGGGGGTQTMGGTTFPVGQGSNLPNTPGALGIGGEAYRDGEGTGGGGGGYYGGGAGYFAGGGGGSSFVGTLANASTVAGVRTGAGRVIISW
jgi:PKD repeat protein